MLYTNQPLIFVSASGREPLSNYLDDFGGQYHQGSQHRRGQLAATEAPRQTVDAYLADELTPRHRHRDHHHHQHSHHRKRKSGASRRRRQAEIEVGTEEPDVDSQLERASSTLNLDDISCPGCREAVANEVLLHQRCIN